MTIILDDGPPAGWGSKAPVTPPARVHHDLPAGTERPLITPGSDEWFTTISASKIAAITGTSPYESAYSLWHKMAGLVARGEQTTAMARGHYLEPAVAAWFRDQHPEWVIRPSGTWVAAANQRWTASPDRLVHKPEHDASDLLQIKSTTKGHEWGAPGSASIPPDYLDQVQWEMHVVGASRCHVAIIGAFLEFAEYVVDYDQHHVARLVEQADAFLALLDARTPPSADSHGSTFDTMREVVPVDDGASVDLPEPIVRRYVTAIGAAKAAEIELTGAKAAVVEALGGAKVGRYEGVKVCDWRAPKAGAKPTLYAAKVLPTFEPTPDPTDAESGDDATAEPVAEADPTEERTAEIRERIAAIKASHPGQLGTVWPEGIPPKGPWTLDDMAHIGDALHILDGRGSWWPPADPARVAAIEARTTARLAPATEVPAHDTDTSPLVDDHTRSALVRALDALTPAQAQRVETWRAEGRTGGRPWGHVGAGRMTELTFCRVLAAVRCAETLWDDDEPDALTRAALANTIGHDLADQTTGAVIGSLTIDQATRLDDIAAAFGAGDETTTKALGHAVVRVV